MVKEIKVDIVSKRYKYALLVLSCISLAAVAFVLTSTCAVCADTETVLREVSVEAALVYTDTITSQIVIWPMYASSILLVVTILMCVKSYKCKRYLRLREGAKIFWDYRYNIFELRNGDKSVKFKPAFSVCSTVSNYTLVVENFKVTLLIPLYMLPDFTDLVNDISER